MYVTLIEAYHCVGAVIFLIKGGGAEVQTACGEKRHTKDASGTCLDRCRDASVLCTGDVRTEQWWRAGLRHLPFLQPYMTGEKGLCNIYLDSAFYYRMEPYIEIPPNNMSIHTAVCLLKKYLMDDPEIMFEFTDTTLGFEQV